jgi:MYXO-CTERM domain-containing protein
MSVRTRPWRFVLAAAMAAGVSWVPVANVAACSCAMQELPEALATAEVAVVGRISGAAEVQGGDMPGQVAYTIAVERSRDPLPEPEISVVAWADNGANCGITLGVDERWLILAYGVEGVLETNGCTLSRPLDGTDADVEASVAEVLTEVPDSSSAPDDTAGISIPTQILYATGALAVLAVAGFFAFRRREVT